MKRRTFIFNAAATWLLPSVVIQGCQTKVKSEGPASVDEDSFVLDEFTIEVLQRKMADNELTARSILELYLKRVQMIDKEGPGLHAVIEINPDALAIADLLDAERKNGKVRGPLHGIPFLLKDNIDTADKMMTTAGSLALEGHHAKADAPIVEQLRNAGAVLMGKTNLSEWANFRSNRSSSGWSSRGGQTKNPYSLDRNPCGSSSGSGVAVAANLCAFAIGTETNGSIICPSSINGIVGIKPTVGLVSRTGIIPISKTQDTAGPMTRTVHDAALVLSAISALDEQDPPTRERPKNHSLNYAALLNVHALQGKRIGIEKSYLKVHEGVDVLLEKALQQMRAKGAIIVEVNLVERLKEISDNEYKVLQYEFKDGLNRYLTNADANVKSLKDVIDFNTKNEVNAMPFFKQEILEASEAKGDLQTDEYKQALSTILSVSRGAIDGIMQEHALATIIGPAAGPSWCTDLINGDSFGNYGMSTGPAIAGYPAITVPMGTVHGLPVGLCFIGKAYQEAELFALAYAYEQASKNRRKPDFRINIQ
ncbi:MAG: amidase [Cyclobacteriaceae bacterium]